MDKYTIIKTKDQYNVEGYYLVKNNDDYIAYASNLKYIVDYCKKNNIKITEE